MTGLIIAIVLGWAGGYRFYKKQVGLGILYLLSGGICGIGWIVDIICAYKEYHPTKPVAVKNGKSGPSYMIIDRSKYMEPRAEFCPHLANQKNYIVYDFETTGVDPHSCEIVEIGALKVADGQVVDRFQSLVKPYNPIPADATRVNHITNDMVSAAPTAEQVFPSFLDFIGDSNLVGYNIMRFDHIILRRYAMAICGKFLDNYISDAYLLGSKILDLDRYTLSDVANHFGIEHSNVHRSVGDCEITLAVFKELQKLYRDKKEDVDAQ